jgi:hypothetical protein
MSDPPDSESSPWAQVIGPCYDAHQMRIILAVNPTELVDLVTHGKLFALQTADGRSVFPTFQFGGTEPLSGFAEVLGAIDPEGIDGWSLASFLVGKGSDEIGGMSIVEWLAGGGDPTVAVALARKRSAQWMQ